MGEAAKEAEDGGGRRGRGRDGEGARDGEEGGRTGGREELAVGGDSSYEDDKQIMGPYDNDVADKQSYIIFFPNERHKIVQFV